MTNRDQSAASVDGAADCAGRARKRVRKDALPSASDGANTRAAPIAVRWLPVEALKPDKRNARAHSARQVARIADSILAFGFNVPILVDERGGVPAGHGRVRAAKALGLAEVPTITLGHLNEAQRRAFMIADNRLAELASWDDGRLGAELLELKSLDLDFALSVTGFEMKEIDLRIGSVDAVHSARLQGPAVSRTGDTWVLGPHRLVCGEAADADAFLALDAAIRQ